jgi:hypothetical protein
VVGVERDRDDRVAIGVGGDDASELLGAHGLYGGTTVSVERVGRFTGQGNDGWALPGLPPFLPIELADLTCAQAVRAPDPDLGFPGMATDSPVSQRYADQNERDYEAFADAVHTGRIAATEGV